MSTLMRHFFLVSLQSLMSVFTHATRRIIRFANTHRPISVFAASTIRTKPMPINLTLLRHFVERLLILVALLFIKNNQCHVTEIYDASYDSIRNVVSSCSVARQLQTQPTIDHAEHDDDTPQPEMCLGYDTCMDLSTDPEVVVD